jgi:hypothetical protein
MSHPDASEGDALHGPVATGTGAAAERVVGDGAATFRVAIVARAPRSGAAPAVSTRDEDRAEGEALVKLAEDLQTAIENDDVRLARDTHFALGRQLQRTDGDERVVDLARERARRRRVR